MGWRRSFSAPARRRELVAVLGALMAATGLLAACGGSARGGGAASSTRDKPGDLGDGISVVVSDMALGGDSRGSWLQVRLRVENHGNTVITNPQAAVFCSGDARAGGWQAQSTYRRYDQLGPGNSAEGTLNLLLPGDDRGGGTLSLACSTPAVLRIYRIDGGTTVELPIPNDYVSRLAKRSAGIRS